MNYKQCSNLTVQTVDDEMLILDVDKDKIHQLNPTACYIWTECDGKKSEQDLANLLVEHYNVDSKTALNDVSKVLQDLQKLELVYPVD